ncbi:MAG TPA: OmpA family protein [Spirochaetota bacterium]|nr:OmpA family protein [Spirochaetota bacterium]
MLKLHRNIKIALALAVVMILFIAAEKETRKFVNPGFRINSEGDDFSPSITSDASIMVFSSKKPVEKSHNIFICKKKNGRWSDPFPVFELCTDSNDETPFISADGKTILFASDRPGGYSPPMTADGKKRITFDIYISHFGDGKWSPPELLRGDVNTKLNERTPSLSRDGRYLFFTRWPYKNAGRSAIYMAEFQNGRYVNPEELPESINSGNFEVAFIPSYKNNRYYFASMRKGGHGGWDIYYTTMTGKKFSEPVNAGPDINSVFDDIYFAETVSDYVICKNVFGGLGGYDLYMSSSSVLMQQNIENRKNAYSKVTKLKVSMADSLTGRLLKNLSLRVDIITDTDNSKPAARSLTLKTGDEGELLLYPRKDVRWFVIEPLDAEYRGAGIKIKVIPEQYQDIALYLKHVPVKEKKAPEEKAGTADEDKINKGSATVPFIISEKEGLHPEFRSVYFNFDSVKVHTDDIPVLYTIVEYMRENDSVNLHITGYADPVGSRKINKRISYARAVAVRTFILGMGIRGERITVEGKGEKKSKGKRYSEMRRVDFKIID